MAVRGPLFAVIITVFSTPNWLREQMEDNMKWSFRNILTLVACLTIIPTTALALSSDDYTLSTSNIGLTGGPYATVAAAVSGSTATFIFDACDGYKLGSIGLNLIPDPATVNWSSDPTGLYTKPTERNMDGLGTFNYTFSMIGSEGLAGAVDGVTLTLTWEGLNLTDLSQIIALNAKDNFLAAHVIPLTGDTFYSTTPIPATAWLLASGLLGLLGVRRRMQS